MERFRLVLDRIALAGLRGLLGLFSATGHLPAIRR
jgi:hypothetical protein